jgi:hypothetical protein
MTVESTAKPQAKFLLTHEVRSQIAKLLSDARPQHQAKTFVRMERLAAGFNKRIGRLGFRPSIEDWDRSLGSRSFANALTRRIEKLSPGAYQERWVGVGIADRLLCDLSVGFARCWKSATGRGLPKLPPGVLKQAGTGYRPGLDALAACHPLWLFLDAVGVSLSARTVNQLIAHARSASRIE